MSMCMHNMHMDMHMCNCASLPSFRKRAAALHLLLVPQPVSGGPRNMYLQAAQPAADQAITCLIRPRAQTVALVPLVAQPRTLTGDPMA